jgi:hypothetical protein
LSWTDTLATPQESDGGKAKYGVGCLFPKGYDTTPLKQMLVEKGEEEHGKAVRELLKAKKVSWPMKDGAQATKDDGTLWAGFEAGSEYVNAYTTNQPGFRDAAAKPCTADKFYGGCWALVTVHAYSGTWEDKKTKAKSRYISVGLNNLQFLADDERFGRGGSDPDEEFEPIDGTGDADAMFNGKGEPAGKSDYDFG